jgi:hypothetical protein
MDVTSGKWWYRACLANMNAARTPAGNKAPVLAYRVDYSKGEFQGFGFAGVHGKAANFTDGTTPDDTTGEPDLGQRRQEHAPRTCSSSTPTSFAATWTCAGPAQPTASRRRRHHRRPDGVAARRALVGPVRLAAYKFDAAPRRHRCALDYVNNKKNGGGLLGYSSADDRNGIGPDMLQTATKWRRQGRQPQRAVLGMPLSRDNINTTFKAEYRIDRANLPVFYQRQGRQLPQVQPPAWARRWW